MSSLETKDVRNNLCRKGFAENNKGKDHIWLNYVPKDGKKTTIRTKLSHGKSTIGDPLIGMMAKQLHLDKKRFVELVSCTLSGEQYYEIVKDQL